VTEFIERRMGWVVAGLLAAIGLIFVALKVM
jgi:hypothetical protein